MKPQTLESAAARIATAPDHYRWMIQGPARFAVVRGGRTVREVLAYLPENYHLMESFEEDRGPNRPPALVVIIGGHDSAGWTLDGYVIPRLASGLIAAAEIL